MMIDSSHSFVNKETFNDGITDWCLTGVYVIS